MIRHFPNPRCLRLVGLVLAGVTALSATSYTVAQGSLTKIPGAGNQAKPGGAEAGNAQAHPSVLLITIDTLRADHVGCYGAMMVKTPTLDALAHDGVVFERAISQVPLTWPSHAVILTGTYPFQNGVQDFSGQPLSSQFRSVAQAFKQAGYATGAVVSTFVLDRSWGLARGFDFYDDEFSVDTFERKDINLVERRAAESVAHAISWLKKTPHRPFFLWLHLYDPHSPYDPPEPYRSQYRSHLYDGEIAYADHELGRLMAWLKQNKLYDSALIVALSDHGESLGEHGEDEHGFFIYNATVHVPLIIKPSSASHISPGRRRDVVETAAVAPTLIKLAGVEDAIEEQFQAHVLLGSAAGNIVTASQPSTHTSGAPGYSETLYPFSSFGWSPLHALETERFHFIQAPNPELYDLETDPGETHNILPQQPSTVAVFHEKLQSFVAQNPFAREDAAAGTLSPDAQEKLRALGYFGFRAAVSPEALKNGLADPKDKLWEFNSILQAQDALRQNDDEHAKIILAEVQQKDPRIYVIPFMLGELALRKQNWDEASKQLGQCLALNPNFDSAMTGFALALAKRGRVDEAKSWLQKAVQINPANYRAWYQVGLLDAESDAAAALASYERAIAIQPNFAPGQRETGLALFQQKDYAAAAIHLEKTISLGLEDARLHNFLGICYSQMNRMSKAVREHQRAIALDPTLAEAHLNLAYVYQRTGKNIEAHAEYETACKLETKFCGVIPR